MPLPTKSLIDAISAEPHLITPRAARSKPGADRAAATAKTLGVVLDADLIRPAHITTTRRWESPPKVAAPVIIPPRSELKLDMAAFESACRPVPGGAIFGGPIITDIERALIDKGEA